MAQILTKEESLFEYDDAKYLYASAKDNKSFPHATYKHMGYPCFGYISKKRECVSTISLMNYTKKMRFACVYRNKCLILHR